MSAGRWMAPGFAVLAALALAFQLGQLLRSPAGLERVPLFEPASYGASHSLGAPGCEEQLAALDDNGRELASQVPYDRFAAGLDSLARARELALPADIADRQAELAEMLGAVREIRNQRHAWNVRSMELAVELAGALTDEQLEWVLANRDEIARQQSGAGAPPPPAP